jgi:hypothetical protein
MNDQLYGRPGAAMTPQQIQQFNALNGLLTADRSHLPASQQYDPGVVRVAGTRENQLGGMTTFNSGIMQPLQSGQANTMAEAVQMAQARGLRHEDRFGQNLVSSNNLGSLAGQWDRRQNSAMQNQRGVLVAFNPDGALQQPTMDFIRSMQGTYGLNLGTNPRTGRANTIEDVQAALQSGRGGQFGNFHLVSPQNQAQLTAAFQGMNGYRERMAYVGAHGNMGVFQPGMAAQRGLQGANDGSVDFGNGARFNRTQLQDATRGFNGFLFYDTCNGGSLVQAPGTRPGFNGFSPFADEQFV